MLDDNTYYLLTESEAKAEVWDFPVMTERMRLFNKLFIIWPF